jgi:hypothetical protein
MGMMVNGVYQKKKKPVTNGSKIQMKEVMVTIILGVNDIFFVDFLPDGEPYNSEYFVKHILNRLHKMKDDVWYECDVKKIWLHLDNSRIHNSKVTLEITEKYCFKRAPHPSPFLTC